MRKVQYTHERNEKVKQKKATNAEQKNTLCRVI